MGCVFVDNKVFHSWISRIHGLRVTKRLATPSDTSGILADLSMPTSTALKLPEGILSYEIQNLETVLVRTEAYIICHNFHQEILQRYKRHRYDVLVC